MDRKECPTCGAEIGVESPRGLCPSCLLKSALAPDEPGRSRTLSCSTCDEPMPEDARFCPRCGATVPTEPGSEGDTVRTALEKKLQGQYRLLRRLGRGGMGSVYLARDLTLDREVAIKVLRGGAGVYDRLRREARTAARLSHPNIVPLHSFGELTGVPYLVMGYVRGESLASRLRRDGRIPENEARRILAEIAGALDHAHRQRVIHRDVKPENVLLEDATGRALLTDFGIARALGTGGTSTQAGTIVGTPDYMSPEQAKGRADLDARTDIYSLGVMAYAMLSGRLPFEAGTPMGVLSLHITQKPVPLRALMPSISEATSLVVDRCLAKEPSARFPDARELQRVLEPIDTNALPEELQAVEGQGLVGLMVALLLLGCIKLVDVALHVEAPSVVYAFNAAVVGVCYLAVLVRLSFKGFRVGQAQQVIWTEPAWWPLWYPRPLRRQGNVWDRLPAVARYQRSAIALLPVAVAACLYRPGELFELKAGVLTASILAWSILDLATRATLRRKGLSARHARAVALYAPPGRARFWSLPHIAPILAPADRELPQPRPDSPHDQLRDIVHLAEELSGSIRPLGSQAVEAARHMLASIEHDEREIAELSRSLEPGERSRLSDRIATLAPERDGPDEHAPMRALLEKQLELVAGLENRLEATRSARGRHVEILKTLALQLASLRASAAEPAADVRSLSDRVHALCDEIGRMAAGAATEPAGNEVTRPLA